MMVVMPYNDTPVMMRVWPVIPLAVRDHGAQTFEQIVQNANCPSCNSSTYRTIADIDGPFGDGRAGRKILRNTGYGLVMKVP